jgi:ATP-dependent helicase HrpA
LLVLRAGPSAAAVMRNLDRARRLAIAASGVEIEELAEDCSVAAIDTILDEHGELPWNAEAFDDLRQTAAARAPGIASAALATAADVLAAESRIRRRLAELVAESARPVVADVEAQLGRFLTPGFVVTVGTGRLPDVLRYLGAVEYRLERLDVARDVRRVQELAALERRYDELRRQLGAGASDAALADIGWQLEELRVSVFAQHLGTTRPVSLTRIRRALDALEP